MQVKKAVMLTIMIAAFVAASGAMLVSAQTGGLPPDNPGLVGVRYEIPISAPTITQEQAIQAAKAQLGTMANQATQVTTQHVLLSDDQYDTTDAQGQKQFLLQKVPAWVVTFEGVNFAGHGGGRGARQQATPRYNHEVHVAINAETGAYIVLYTYR